jgi:hypothetical protein
VIALLCIIGPAMAIGVNDQLALELDGGETIDGWFVRSGGDHVFVHLPSTGDTERIPLSMLKAVEVNGHAVEAETFAQELVVAHNEWLYLRANPPVQPPAAVVALSSLALAGSGHAWLGDWENAPGLLVADTIGMGVFAWEMGHAQRLNVLVGTAAVSIIMKAYGANKSARKARARRRKFGMEKDR